MHPAIAQRLRGGLGLVPVALEVAGAAHDDFAHFTRRQRGARFRVDDADFIAWHGLALGAPANRVVRHAGVHGVGFRQAIRGLKTGAVRSELFPLLRQRLGQRDAEAGDRVHAQRCQVALAQAGHLHQGGVHGGDAVPPAHAVALQRLRHAQGVKPVHQHRGGAGEYRHVHAHDHAGNVVQRRDRQQHIVAAHTVALRGRRRLEQCIAIGQHGALGQARGARGVGHQCHIVHGDLHRGGRAARAHGGQKVFAPGGHGCGRGTHGQQLRRHINGGGIGQQFGVAHDKHMLQCRLGAHLVHHGQKRFGRHDDTRLQVAQLVLQFVLFVQRAAGADDGTDLLDAKVRHEVLRTVVQEQRYRVALFHPQGLQARGKGIAGAVQLGPGDGVPVPDAGHAFRGGARMAAQVFVQGLCKGCACGARDGFGHECVSCVSYSAVTQGLR